MKSQPNLGLELMLQPSSPDLTDLEMWTFYCIVSVFLSLLTYAIILFKDQMIIQVPKQGWNLESLLHTLTLFH